MKKLLAHWKMILIIVFAVIIAIMIFRGCGGAKIGSIQTTTVTHDTIKGDSIKYTVTVDKPVIRKEYLHDTLYKVISCDSARVIVKDWSNIRLYSDSVKKRDVWLKYDAIVFHNILDTIKFDLSNLRETVINNYTIITNPPLKNRLYITASGGYDFLNKNPVIGAGIALISKKRFGYELHGNTAGIVQFQLNYKIGK